MTLAETFRYLSVASLLTLSAATKAVALNKDDRQQPAPFSDVIRQITSLADSGERNKRVDKFVAEVKHYGRAIIEDDTVHFLYHGNAKNVFIAGDLNGWRPSIDTLTRVSGTNLFHLAKVVERAARFEYKIVADSVWMLDPLNQQQAMGGYGANSEIWMPGYAPPAEINFRKDVPHGVIDTITIKSDILGRTHTGFVYCPPGYSSSKAHYPSIYITDGGEYLSLALMNNVLDNLIADGRIEPVIAIFIDPRLDIRNSETSMRMHDYTMSDSFVNFMVSEVKPRIVEKYHVSNDPSQTAIMGASLGGLIATYAGFTHPEQFGLVAAQSASFWWKEHAMTKLLESSPRKPIRFYIDTGTILDARDESRKMRDVLENKGYELHYHEYPEGHNWVNWRARLDDILEYFWGTKQ